jgi:hypothetical protein
MTANVHRHVCEALTTGGGIGSPYGANPDSRLKIRVIMEVAWQPRVWLVAFELPAFLP